ncbi:MAG: SPOR domain-containing protein [Myxococcota bacterium]
MKNESVIIDKKQVFLLFFSSIVIMILVFGTGVLLGKKLSGVAVDNTKPEKVIRGEEEIKKPLLTVNDTGIADISSQQEKVEKDIPDKKGIEIAENKTPDKKAETSKVETPKPPLEKKEVAESPKTNEKEKKVEKGKVALKSVSSTEEKKSVEIVDAKFTLQVGAFPDRSQALKIAAELEKKGYESWIQRAKSKDKDIFRVRIGKFATKQDAEKFKQQFDKKEKYNSFITPLE